MSILKDLQTLKAWSFIATAEKSIMAWWIFYFALHTRNYKKMEQRHGT